MARPMPLLAPVTNATLLFSGCMPGCGAGAMLILSLANSNSVEATEINHPFRFGLICRYIFGSFLTVSLTGLNQ